MSEGWITQRFLRVRQRFRVVNVAVKEQSKSRVRVQADVPGSNVFSVLGSGECCGESKAEENEAGGGL